MFDLFLSSNPNICKTSTSGLLGNFYHSVVNVVINFNTISSRDPPIYRKLFSCHRGDWDNFLGLIRDLPLYYIFRLDAEKCTEEISSWFQIDIDAFIPSHKYHVKPHSTFGSLSQLLLLFPIAITFIIVINVVVVRTTGVFLLESAMIIKKSLRRLNVVIKTRFMIVSSLNLSVLVTGVSIEAFLIR